VTHHLLDGRGRSVIQTVYFRGISISSVLSKIFEHCILNRFANYLTSSDNQFGIQKKMGCVHAIFSMRRVIERYTM